MTDANTPNNRGAAGTTSSGTTTSDTTIDMLRELMREMASYARDLARMFMTELGEKSRSMRYLAAMGGAAALFGFFSFAFLSGALIGAIAYGLASWRWALLIVGVGYGFLGLLLLIPVGHALQGGLLSFEHTQRHLKDDAEWVKHKLAA